MIRHLVAAGCSFTADGIGGSPPVDATHPGGCSFIHSDQRPRSWAGFLAQRLQVTSLVNVAGYGFGIGIAAQATTWLLENFDYSSDQTLVVFNITDPYRLGTICPFYHEDVSRFVPWASDIIPWAVLDRETAEKPIYKIMQTEQVEARSSFDLRALIDYLERRGYQYRFMMMMDYRNHPLIGDTIKNNANLVLARPGASMFDYSMMTQQLDADGMHPSTRAHEMLAQQVYDTLEID